MSNQNSTPLSVDTLKEYLHYDDSTGIFTRIISRGGRSRVGDIAGTEKSTGYIEIRIDKKIYKAHRLAWLYVYGEFPKHEVDHINGIRKDNRIVNLRDVKKSGNQRNQRGARSDNLHGYMGVKAQYGRWQARIVVNKQCFYLGTFGSPDMAHQAYLTAKRSLHETCTI